jgi:SAM-dependent methyltransferase
MDYSRIASTYEWLERATFGKKLQCARTAYLDRLVNSLPTTANVLIIGDGDGRFLEALLARFPTLSIDYVEPSPAMMALAKKRVACDARVHWINKTIQEWCSNNPSVPDSKQYDLIVTHFVLDSIHPCELTQLTQNVRTRMAPDGRWLLADFDSTVSTLASYIVAGMYVFFYFIAGVRWQKLKKFNPLFESQQLHLHDQKEWMGRLIYSQLWTTKE